MPELRRGEQPKLNRQSGAKPAIGSQDSFVIKFKKENRKWKTLA